MLRLEIRTFLPLCCSKLAAPHPRQETSRHIPVQTHLYFWQGYWLVAGAAMKYCSMTPHIDHRIEHPVIGGIYRDESERSFAVLSISGTMALLEYADGTLTAVELRNWQQLQPKQAVF
jgi:hypothetical protein